MSAGAEIFSARGYRSELAKVENSGSRRSMETLYARGQELCDELAESLDGMDERELARSTAALKGVEISTSEPSGVWLNPVFLQALAGRKGKKADRDFFSILAREKAADGWDIYTRPLTAFSGCVSLGSGAFVELYGRWAVFRAKYPRNYFDAAQEAMENIEDILRRASCVCGNREKALAELKIFIKTFPETPALEDLAERAARFRKKAPGVNFDCKAEEQEANE